MTQFEQQLELGHAGEKIVDRVLRERGCGVIQSYAFMGDKDEKAPRLRFADIGYILPDLDVVAPSGRIWVEVKTLWHAPENRKLGINVHGIMVRLYKQYLLVESKTGAFVFLFVLEVSTGDLLTAKLRDLKIHPCQIRHDHSDRCLFFFDRQAFTRMVNVSSDTDFQKLKSVFKGAAA